MFHPLFRRKFHDRCCEWNQWESSFNDNTLLSSVNQKANGQYHNKQSKFTEFLFDGRCSQRYTRFEFDSISLDSNLFGLFDFFPIDRHFGNIFEMDIQRRFGFIACWNQNTNRLFYWAVGLDGESNTDSFTFQALISAAKQNRSVQNIRKHIQSLLVNYSSPYK